MLKTLILGEVFLYLNHDHAIYDQIPPGCASTSCCWTFDVMSFVH